MKKFEFTEEDREEMIKLIKNRSLLGAKNYLNQLIEIKEKKNGKISG